MSAVIYCWPCPPPTQDEYSRIPASPQQLSTGGRRDKEAICKRERERERSEFICIFPQRAPMAGPLEVADEFTVHLLYPRTSRPTIGAE